MNRFVSLGGIEPPTDNNKRTRAPPLERDIPTHQYSQSLSDLS